MAATTLPFFLQYNGAAPLDNRHEVDDASIADVSDLENYIASSFPGAPYEGMTLYCVQLGRRYVIDQLSPSVVVSPAGGAGGGGVLITGSTSGATSTLLTTSSSKAEMPAEELWLVGGQVAARSTSGGAATWLVEATWQADSTRTLTAVGVPSIRSQAQDPSLSGAGVTVAPDGAVPTVRVTGVSGADIQWGYTMYKAPTQTP